VPGELVGSLLERCDFPPAGQEVTIAVSGGPDSLALLVLANAAGLRVTAIHVDHGLRCGSDGEAETVARASARYGAAFEARTVQVEPGGDLEARARSARYSVLPIDVMTGHTMDDQAETVLLNLVRGAGLDGLSGIRRTSDASRRLRRPLLRVRRAETESLCELEGLKPVRDPSNDGPDFRRNRIRREVIPLLSEVAGRDVVPVLARQADLLADEADLLDELSADLDPTDARSLRGAPLPLARRALRRWLRAPDQGGDPEAHPPSAAEVARVMSVAQGLATACELAGGRRVSRSAGRLEVQSGAPAEGR
jgi:tRNA(Ile)-lysidine synthase